MRAPSLDWIVRVYIQINVVLLIMAVAALCIVTPIHAANGPPPLAGIVAPVQEDDGESGDEAKFTFCFYGL